MRTSWRRINGFEVGIVEDPEFLCSPAIADYDVIIVHFKKLLALLRDRQVRENLAKFVRQGKGLVVMHLACGAFENWPEFVNLAGKTYDQGKAAPHAPGKFTVKIVQPRASHHARECPISRPTTSCISVLVGDRPVDAVGHGTLESHR